LDEEKLADFVRRYVARLLKADKLAVLGELERQEEVDLAVKVWHFPLILNHLGDLLRRGLFWSLILLKPSFLIHWEDVFRGI